MSAAPAAVVAAATAAIIRPRVESWARTAARVEQASIEAQIESSLAREAAVQDYLERRARRARAKIEQLAFDFEANLT
jgi:hypothetical protein